MSDLKIVKAVGDLPPLPSGSLRLYDNLLPKLKAVAGPSQAYQITITQVVDFPHFDKPAPPLPERTFSNAQAFVVEGPQFLLNSAQDVFSVSPASNEQGRFANQFPHIVMTDPHLPWVRAIDPANVQANPGTPWMALLLFDDVDFSAGLPDVRSLPIAEIVSPPPSENVFRPVLNNVLDSDLANTSLRINAIDIPTAAFLGLVPRFEELPLLAHVREVNPANKEERLLFGDGLYSTVVASRFPRSTDSGAKNGCYLVSLEGFSAYLPRVSGSAPSTISQPMVRLVVLASWQFTSTAQPVSFSDRVDNLSSGLFGFAPAPPATGDAAAYVAQATANGYVPLNYRPSWLGEHTMGWYRGPLAPFIIEEALPLHYDNVEAAMIYDAATGFFDLSYAVAWQVGRLLAMSSRDFANQLMQARQQAGAAVLTAAQRAALLAALDERLSQDVDLRDVTRPHLVRELAHAYVAERLGGLGGPRSQPLFGLRGV